MYAIRITTIKRGPLRKTIRWAEKIGDEWFMIPNLSNIVYNKSEGITNNKKRARKLLLEAHKALKCNCEIVRVGFIEIGLDMLL